MGSACVFGCGGPTAVAPSTAPTASASAAPTSSGAPLEASAIKQVACGDFHSCALLGDGSVSCWGRNKSGELGDGTDADHPTPTRVPGVSDAVEIALGANFSCARLKDGSVTCWGSGRVLGDNRLVSRQPPTKVANLAGVIELRAGGYMTCARSATSVTCWGLDAAVGKSPDGVQSVAVAGAHACAKLTGNRVECWGEGVWQRSANPTYATPGLDRVEQIATGDSFACVVQTGGAVACWGRNDESGLGTQADDDNHTTATVVPGVQGVASLSSSESHTCAALASGKLACWGSNSEGELARGTQTTGESAALVPDVDGVTQIAMGADHGCAIAHGRVLCWGANRSGQVGDGTTQRRLSPVAVPFH